MVNRPTLSSPRAMKSSRRAVIGQGKRERTRATLIEAAYRVIAQKETESVTIDDIIAEAGVARGTFYNYFQTREDVLISVAVFLRDEMVQRLEPQQADSDPAERIATAIRQLGTRVAHNVRQLLHRALHDPTWGWVVVRIGLAINPLRETIETGMMTDLEAGIQQGRFNVESVQAAVTLILGTGFMALRRILEEQTEDNFPEQVTKIILQALGIAEAHAIAFLSLEPLDIDSMS